MAKTIEKRIDALEQERIAQDARKYTVADLVVAARDGNTSGLVVYPKGALSATNRQSERE